MSLYKRLSPSNLWRRLFDGKERLQPVSRVFGLDRGQSIARYYIEQFLRQNAAYIRGRVLEVGDPRYTLQFGKDRVTSSEVVHVHSGNPQATIVGDLATGQGIPGGAFDCIILTQTLQFIYDVNAAIANSYAALASGGTLLATGTGISQISRYDMDRWGDYWRFTDASIRRLFGSIFGGENVSVVTYGNVRTASAFLQGRAAEELTKRELAYSDEDYQVVIAVRAFKTNSNEAIDA